MGNHQNENGIRPTYLKLALFKRESDSAPAASVMLTGPMNDDEWNGTFTELPVYDTDGKVIDCSAYAIKEACRKTVNTDGTPASRLSGPVMEAA